jgi:leucyl aminopeptidase
MGTSLAVTATTDLGALGDLDTIAFPVASLNGAIVVPTGLPAELGGTTLPGSIDEAFAARHRFTAKAGQILVVSQSQGAPTVLAVGIGDPLAPDDEAWRKGAAAVVTKATGARGALLLTLPSTVDERRLGEATALGATLASYSYLLRSSEPRASLDELLLVPVATHGVSAQASDDFRAGVEAGKVLASATSTARDMVNRIPSEMTPRKLANSMLRRLEKSPDVTVSVWRQPRIEEERLGGLLGVARGSAEEPRLVIATYDPGASDEENDALSSEREGRWSTPEVSADPTDVVPAAPRPHIVLVGKGVTFDSGGLSLKTATGMTTMKTDMTGAAVVLAALTACGALGVTAKVTAIAPMTENMPGGAAMKPGDVLTTRDGTTVEVLNTDAEGRLILADALALAVELQPDAIIDVATLTGAAVVALGGSVAALMANNQELADDLLSAARTAGEPLWQLPLFTDYESQLDSEIADLKNIGSPGQAGSITAGLFLQRFVGEIPWAHLDIAGPSRAEKTEGYIIKGGTAFSLRTLLAFLRAAS